jgi:multicomponent Na+:H+ antiporter subunit D
MVRIWGGAFWSPPEDDTAAARPHANQRGRGLWLMVAPTAALVACSIAVAIAAGPLYALSERTAADLVDRDAYIARVIRP